LIFIKQANCSKTAVKTKNPPKDGLVFTNMDRLAVHLHPSSLAVTKAVLGVLLAALAVQLKLGALHNLGLITMLAGHQA
jgi:hypothetical protein